MWRAKDLIRAIGRGVNTAAHEIRIYFSVYVAAWTLKLTSILTLQQPIIMAMLTAIQIHKWLTAIRPNIPATEKGRTSHSLGETLRDSTKMLRSKGTKKIPHFMRRGPKHLANWPHTVSHTIKRVGEGTSAAGHGLPFAPEAPNPDFPIGLVG